MFKLEDIKKYPRYNNKRRFREAEKARCYYCGNTYPTSEIWEWDKKEKDGYIVWDNDGYYFCHKCNVDAVLPESEEYNIEDDDFIRAMALYWFNGYARYTDITEEVEEPEDYYKQYFELFGENN